MKEFRVAQHSSSTSAMDLRMARGAGLIIASLASVMLWAVIGWIALAL